MKSISLLVLALALLVSPAANAQGVGASGQIKGTVFDPSGAVVPNATVEVLDTGKGTRYSTVTDASGQFQFPSLPPSTYDLTTRLAGLQTQVQKGLELEVGQTAIVDFHLALAGASAEVQVSAEAVMIEVTRGSQADIVDQKYIADLPINRRDYLTFTLLAPGVSDSTRLASDQDFRVKQTPQSGLSFYGSNGRGNSVTVDGGEANDDAGGVRLTLSQDAVQEFQINRSNYAAELGGASGATINIVSKSGTNNLHGSLYGFFRNDALDARDPFAFNQALGAGQIFNPASPDSTGSTVKDTLGRQQFGGSIGFPIRKDKTFLFLAFEGLRQDAQNAVPLLTNTFIFRGPTVAAPTVFDPTDPRFAQQSIVSALLNEGGAIVPCLNHPDGTVTSLPAQICAGALQQGLTVSQLTGLSAGQNAANTFLVNQFEGNGGVFAFNTREYQASGRLDHLFNENNSVAIRYSFAHDREENPDVQSLTGFSRGSNIHAYDNTLQGAWYHTFNPRAQNELRLQYNYSPFDVIPNEPGEVGLDIPGFANLGTNIFLPSFTIMRRYEAADNITLVRGHHTMKMGADFLYRGNHSESHTFFPGRFVFGQLPGAILSPCFLASGATTNPCGLTTAGARLNSIQSASLGLPQFYEQGFGDPASPRTAVGTYNYPRPFFAGFWQDSWQIKPNFTLNFGLRYELDAQYGQLSTDKDNFAPRVSFAWDPFNDHKTVIRGGAGLFYSPIYGQIADVVQTLGNINGERPIANFLIPITGAPGNPTLNSALIFQTLFAEGKVQCTTPAAGQNACITPADLAQFGINVTNTGALPPLTVLFTGQPGYQSPYSEQVEFGIERQIATGFSISVSGIYSHTLRLPVAIDTNIKPQAFQLVTVPLANGKTATYRDFNSSTAADPLGVAPCQGAAILQCFVNPLILQNNQYSSKASALYEGGIVEVKKRFSNSVSLFANYTYSKAFDTATDFNSDFGPVDNTNLSAERGLSDFDQRHKVVVAAILDSPWKGRVLSGFELSPIVRYNSGHPFDLLAQGVDINGDRHSTNDRPIGAGRNTGRGPDFASFDLRFSWSYKVREKAGLQFIAEGFNLFNRTNFASVNNEVSPAFGLPTALGGLGQTSFNVSGSNIGPSTPLGFTSAFAKRQIQLGIRLTF
jgi:hypothetical protein